MNELVEYFAAEFERLAAASKPRGISDRERVELVQWMKHEFRRLAKTDGDKHGPVIVDRRRYKVRVQAPARPHIEHTMDLPACLRRPDTEAGLARLGLSRIAYQRLPQNAAWAVRLHEERA